MIYGVGHFVLWDYAKYLSSYPNIQIIDSRGDYLIWRH